MDNDPADEFSAISVLFGLIGLALHLTLGFLVLVSGLIAPMWAVALMGLAWVGALIYGAATWRGSIKKALVIPVVSWAGYIGVLMLGDALLGWTA